MSPARGLVHAALAVLALAAACSRAPDQPPPSPALWEVTGGHGEHGYLFGTIHALPDGFRWRTSKLDAAFADANTLVVEAEGLNSPRRMNAIFERLARSDGLPPLASRVPVGKRALVEQALAAQGLNDEDFAKVETWAAALTLSSAAEAGDSANGVDRALLKRADGKRVVELEGVEPQLRLFDALPEPDQADLLVAVAQEAAAGASEQRRRTNDWLTGDIAALGRENESGILADPELHEVLLAARTRAWAGKIDSSLRAGAVPFVAVGAAHVIGPDGLAALLAERGYRVKRLQ